MPTPIKRVKFIAMALPLAITVGCGHKGAIIDYTIDNDEYAALMAPAPAIEAFVASSDENMNAPAFEQTDAAQIVLASSPPQLPAQAEPVLAAALPPESLMELEPAMAAATPASTSIVAAEMASAEAIEEASAALEATRALEAKVAELEALTKLPKPRIEPAMAEPTMASAIDINRLGFTPSIYTTAGLGVSRMNPDTSADENFTPNDITEPAGQLGIGVDVARFLSLEAHTADYGSVSLYPEGRVNYHVHGVSALIYAGKNLDRFRRRGFNGYARIGFNQVENTPIGNIPFIERRSNHASFGVGAEYTTRIGLGLRADLVAYDGDVQYGQLGILYRLASKPRILPKLAAATDESSAPEPVSPDFDDAIKTDSNSQIAMHPPTEQSNFPMPDYTHEYTSSDECTGLNGTLQNVNFMNGSAELTHSASIALNSVASTLMDCPDRQIVVSAHTDSNGSAVANNSLSKQRARAVAMHISTRGIHRSRISAVAFGESRPIASNATQDGRMTNRRVELEVR